MLYTLQPEELGSQFPFIFVTYSIHQHALTFSLQPKSTHVLQYFHLLFFERYFHTCFTIEVVQMYCCHTFLVLLHESLLLSLHTPQLHRCLFIFLLLQCI